ncbi:hypothetical protein ACIQGZ_17400 [Streptomyces sp. NPDC092296]|uniref:hypothetical protein n=1 Tax=Streptomyces sp. NPDC092296 TaxID=3366012 RepID=UPI0037FFB7F1
MPDAHAERDTQIIAWLLKKACEYDHRSGGDYRIAAGVARTFASKIRRGAVRPDNLRTLPATDNPAPEWQDDADDQHAAIRDGIARHLFLTYGQRDRDRSLSIAEKMMATPEMAELLTDYDRLRERVAELEAAAASARGALSALRSVARHGDMSDTARREITDLLNGTLDA